MRAATRQLEEQDPADHAGPAEVSRDWGKREYFRLASIAPIASGSTREIMQNGRARIDQRNAKSPVGPDRRTVRSPGRANCSLTVLAARRGQPLAPPGEAPAACNPIRSTSDAP